MPKHNPIRHDLVLVATVLALTTVEWWENRDHHDQWERAYSITRALIAAACVIAALIGLSGCKPAPQTPPPVTGIDQGHVDFSPEQALVEHLQGANR